MNYPSVFCEHFTPTAEQPKSWDIDDKMSQQTPICHIKLDDLKTITKIPWSDSRNVMRCLVDIFSKYQQQCNKKNRIGQSQTNSME